MASAAHKRGIGPRPRGDPARSRRAEDAGELRELPVELIKPNPNQPRTKFDPEALAGLASSIEASGVVQPLLVRPLPDGSYELIAGERRWRAAQQAGLAKVPAVVRDSGAGRAPAGGADREHGPRGPQPGRGGARLRRPGRGARPLQGGAGPPRRPQPPRGLQPDPPARPSRRGARAARVRRAERGPRQGAAAAPTATTCAAASLATPPAAVGRSARPRTGLKLAGQPKTAGATGARPTPRRRRRCVTRPTSSRRLSATRSGCAPKGEGRGGRDPLRRPRRGPCPGAPPEAPLTRARFASAAYDPDWPRQFARDAKRSLQRYRALGQRRYSPTSAAPPSRGLEEPKHEYIEHSARAGLDESRACFETLGCLGNTSTPPYLPRRRCTGCRQAAPVGVASHHLHLVLQLARSDTRRAELVLITPQLRLQRSCHDEHASGIPRSCGWSRSVPPLARRPPGD